MGGGGSMSQNPLAKRIGMQISKIKIIYSCSPCQILATLLLPDHHPRLKNIKAIITISDVNLYHVFYTSSAFDTVDHNVFLHKLYNEFGIEDEALNWFRSYLDNRKHRVSINGISSDSHKLKCGVPQGSVLGARMYTMYTRQLSHIKLNHGLQHHNYADDTQIYIQCENNVEARSEAMAKLEHCISDICIWMKANALKLNEDKTECIIFSTGKDPVYMTLLAGTQTVKSQDTVKVLGLGVMLDSKMTSNQQISSISRSVHMHIRKIKRIRMYLSDFALKTLIQSTVTVR